MVAGLSIEGLAGAAGEVVPCAMASGANAVEPNRAADAIMVSVFFISNLPFII
ncbi:hypothetical protein D3C80_1699480 [compost metagenome]